MNIVKANLDEQCRKQFSADTDAAYCIPGLYVCSFPGSRSQDSEFPNPLKSLKVRSSFHLAELSRFDDG